jgi:hypothetical protein
MQNKEDQTMKDYLLEKNYWVTGKYVKKKKKVSNLTIIKNLNKAA